MVPFNSGLDLSEWILTVWPGGSVGLAVDEAIDADAPSVRRRRSARDARGRGAVLHSAQKFKGPRDRHAVWPAPREARAPCRAPACANFKFLRSRLLSGQTSRYSRARPTAPLLL